MWRSEQPEVPEHPVDGAEDRVVHPEPADRPQGDRRRPREQDQEPDEPLSPERLEEGVGKDPRQEDDDHLGEEREHEGVPQGEAKYGIRQRRAEVPQTDEVEGGGPGGGVAKGVEDREDERGADHGGDVQDRRRDQQLRKGLLAVEDPSKPGGRRRPRVRGGVTPRLRCGRARSSGRTAADPFGRPRTGTSSLPPGEASGTREAGR